MRLLRRHIVQMTRPRHTRLAAQRARRLRNNQTISETNLWQALRRSQLGVRFRRQVPIGPWIVDFACLDPKIIVEVDDESHYRRQDADRTIHLESLGFVILRVDNLEVAAQYDETVDWLYRSIRRIAGT